MSLTSKVRPARAKSAHGRITTHLDDGTNFRARDGAVVDGAAAVFFDVVKRLLPRSTDRFLDDEHNLEENIIWAAVRG